MARVGLVGLAACGAATAKPVATPAAEDHELHVEIATGADGLHVKVVGHAAQLVHAPLADLIGMPASGTADVAIDVVVPRDARAATGSIEVRCISQCALGDDAAPTRIGSHEFGFSLGKVPIDDFELRATIGGGTLEIAKWTAHVEGIEIAIVGRIELAHDFGDSVITGCARFRPVQADEKMRELAAVSGAPVARDGYYNIRLAGHVGDMRRLAEVCDGSVPIPVDAAPPPPSQSPQLPEHDIDLSAIRQVGPNKYAIDKATIDQIFANPMAVANGARVVPAMKDGKPHGFKLYAIRPTSLFAKLGLLNGDTLVTVNGFDLTSADKALEVYTKLHDATTIELEVERKGVRITIDYVVD
jgi:membrane-associated protease RseP (regulator of RpoE activity)